MLTQEQLKLFKLEHAPKNIFYITFNNREYVFRSLTLKEYREATTLCQDENDLAELICQMVCIYPYEYDFKECGIANLPMYCADIIIRNSKVGDIKAIHDTLELNRQALVDASKQAFMIIKLSFPEITKDMFLDMSWDEILEYVAMSEKIQEMQMRDVKLSINIPETSDDIDEKANEYNINDEVARLYEQGIDPYDYYSIPIVNKYDIVPIPLIGGRHWDDDSQVREIYKYAQQISQTKV